MTESPFGELLSTRLRLVTWNIWWRFGPWEARLPAIIETLRPLDADVICLQEVWIDLETGRSSAGLIADALGYDHVAVANRADLDGLGFGNAVVTRWPISSDAQLDLPSPPDLDEHRTLLQADVSGPRGPLQVFTTHLQTGGCSNDAQSRYHSMGLLKAWAANYSRPQLVSGDFNADPDQIYSAQGMAGAFLNPIATLGLPKPLTAFVGPPTMQLDYWFYDASGSAQPISVDVPNTGTVSDHFPLRATFKLR